MQVKVFEADDMPTALKKVKETLGPEAMILSTRSVRKGKMGLLGKAVLEVTAAVDAPAPGTARDAAPVGKIPSMTPRPASQEAYSRYAAATEEAPARVAQPASGPELNYNELWRKRKVIDPLEEELEELKGKVSSLNVDTLRNEISELKELVRGAVQNRPEPPIEPRPETSKPSKSGLERMMQALTSRGVQDGTAETIVRRAMENYPPRNRSVTLEGFLAGIIAGMVRVAPPISQRSAGPRMVALVGPTGVGKTTTVAKLAADYLLNHGRKLALVTIDIYRIAAAEQLKVYGEIMNIPVEVVLTPEQLSDVIDRHQDKDLILIDTAGRSPRDASGIEELEKFIGRGSNIENHLVLSATTRDQELLGAIRRFGRLPISSLIFSKLDECEGLGSILNVHLKSKFPLSYLTNGQKVPEDLVQAEPGRVASFIMGKQ